MSKVKHYKRRSLLRKKDPGIGKKDIQAALFLNNPEEHHRQHLRRRNRNSLNMGTGVEGDTALPYHTSFSHAQQKQMTRQLTGDEI